MTRVFFFDTYALIEMGKENPNYDSYKEDVVIILNKLNLLEFSYFLFRSNRQAEIEAVFNKYLRFNVDYDTEVLTEAAEMKFKYLKERLSFIDCIGYILAKRHKAKFLTGDEKFRKKDNVEFVK